MLGKASRFARMSTLQGTSGRYSRGFSRTCPSFSVQPNPPIFLDPSLQDLLKDEDMSFLNHKKPSKPFHRELTASPVEQKEPGEDLESESIRFNEEPETLGRKSPAALFGSQKIGQVVIPLQLQEAITTIIEASDKAMIHSDAKRLFAEDDVDEEAGTGWQYQLDTKYHSYKQEARHSKRDAIAFVSAVMPAHLSAIYAVLENTKNRLGSSWEVDRILDWGAGAGTGLWAALYSFQSDSVKPFQREMLDIDAAKSTVKTYIGVDKRKGLTTLAKRIFENIPTVEGLTVQFQKSIKEADRVPREAGDKTVAVSAFVLSSLTTTLARKAMVKEMWDSGAHTLVLIDHNTKAGFEVIAQAREFILRQGRNEMESSEAEFSSTVRGAHVVAPCPHDGACPLLQSGSNRLICGFSQRLQRPEFVRLTKHSGFGFEDVGYSYVVIQRGSRPTSAASISSRTGRAGLVAQWEAEAKASKVLKELELFNPPTASQTTLTEGSLSSVEPEVEAGSLVEMSGLSTATPEPADTFRQEAYSWPRLVFPPMKKSGHVILDSCTAEGKIMRLTIPKSQGKQPYYDARKSSWGDIFPHPPKNPGQERVVVRAVDGTAKPVEGDHIGKNKATKEPSANSIKRAARMTNEVREAKKKNRRWERTVKASVVWNSDA